MTLAEIRTQLAIRNAYEVTQHGQLGEAMKLATKLTENIKSDADVTITHQCVGQLLRLVNFAGGVSHDSAKFMGAMKICEVIEITDPTKPDPAITAQYAWDKGHLIP